MKKEKGGYSGKDLLKLVTTCQSLLSFDLRSVIIEKRAVKFNDGVRYHVRKNVELNSSE